MSPELHFTGWMEIHRLIGLAQKQRDSQMVGRIKQAHLKTVANTLTLAVQLVNNTSNTPAYAAARKLYTQLNMYYDRHLRARQALSTAGDLAAASIKLADIIEILNDNEDIFETVEPGVRAQFEQVHAIVLGRAL